VPLRQVVELELWSAPGAAAIPFDGKLIAQECRQDTGLSSEVVLGLSFVPDQADLERFRWHLNNGKASLEQFEAYCIERSIPAQLSDIASVGEYLAHLEGQPLAWLHLPGEPGGMRQAQKLLQWAEVRGFVVVQAERPESPLAESALGVLWQQ
jgi:hypothetical protein